MIIIIGRAKAKKTRALKRYPTQVKGYQPCVWAQFSSLLNLSSPQGARGGRVSHKRSNTILRFDRVNGRDASSSANGRPALRRHAVLVVTSHSQLGKGRMCEKLTIEAARGEKNPQATDWNIRCCLYYGSCVCYFFGSAFPDSEPCTPSQDGSELKLEISRPSSMHTGA